MTRLRWSWPVESGQGVMTPEAVAGLIGQAFIVNEPGRVSVAQVLAAEIVDGRVVITTDLDPETVQTIYPTALYNLTGLTDLPVDDEPQYSYRMMPSPPPLPDWAEVSPLAPARAQQAMARTRRELSRLGVLPPLDFWQDAMGHDRPYDCGERLLSLRYPDSVDWVGRLLEQARDGHGSA